MGGPEYDVVIIGGGPGGSCAASYLAKAGKKVALLEKERFPRFHVGESLLPYNRRIFDEIGVLPALEAAGFPKKFGAQFHLANGSKSVKFLFSRGVFTRECQAIQVERARFDQILLEHARSLGTNVREGCAVTAFEEKLGHVAARTGQGEFTGRFLIDASGRGNLTGNQQGIRRVHPKLRKLAVFGHFENVRLDAGSERGDTVIVRLADKWFWIIPISPEKTSVGCVMDQAEFAAAREAPEAVFERIWRESPVLRDRLGSARLAGAMHVTSDFSYYNARYAGDRLLRVGDAAGFMDPIFSAGVFLAMHSGKMAANAVIGSLDVPGRRRRLLRNYERNLRRSMEFYWKMVHHFYTTPFLEVFFEPREKFMLASAINAALAGELEGGWNLRWRMRLFFWMVRAQSRLKFLPPICFK